ncbi:PDZ domain-containing protein [Sphingobacterium sp. DK4209]|uniref:PDZ domain-containing protein n=1 Tax=Sphingobacterium zhuxiongii TaxID=2662364 RepID=A0A5Q0Q9D8_9SPHI|nr:MULTISPECIES: PDZ domain-containing protein [unclassified Sphingobacterium]MVZ67598.1 PDZ domain-containing protein [Sphingobacterium sp. DK4209]QGA26707.1 PDZ domain-containing protein [Sphingobacterium sp. dk4302]
MKILALLLLCLMSFMAHGQSDFSFLSKKRSFDFELVGNLIIIPVKLNGVSLSFLLDTGVKETILFASTRDSVPLDNVHKVKFSGIGIEDGVEGIMAVANDLEIGAILRDSTHNVFVIDGEELDISSHIGMPVNGILGARFIQEFMLKIDYVKCKIELFDPFDYPTKLTRKYTRVPIVLERDRPYTEVDIRLADHRLEHAKMLIDMGNSDGMLIFPFVLKDFKVQDPSVYEFIGRGFNGEIFGFRNRISGFDWAGFHIKQPVVSYPDTNAVHAARLAEGRIGSVGNQVLRHFHVILNYQADEIFLRPNRNYGKPFEFNMSGMEIKHDGLVWTQREVATSIGSRDRDNPNGAVTAWESQVLKYEFKLLPVYVVAGVRKNSPAEHVGIQKDDILLRVNGKRTENMKLKDLMSKLQHKDGDLIKLEVERKGEKMEFVFKLVDPIPYKGN